jgi:hypothetical protein
MEINLDKCIEKDIQFGDIVITRNNNEDIKRYLYILNNDEKGRNVLIDLDFSEIRCSVPYAVEHYIENNLEEQILAVIDSDRLVISIKE